MLKKVGGASPTPPKEGLRRGAKIEDRSEYFLRSSDFGLKI